MITTLSFKISSAGKLSPLPLIKSRPIKCACIVLVSKFMKKVEHTNLIVGLDSLCTNEPARPHYSLL
jgi:hypothetical protein